MDFPELAMHNLIACQNPEAELWNKIQDQFPLLAICIFYANVPKLGVRCLVLRFISPQNTPTDWLGPFCRPVGQRGTTSGQDFIDFIDPVGDSPCRQFFGFLKHGTGMETIGSNANYETNGMHCQ
jgi:hypothetical protein